MAAGFWLYGVSGAKTPYPHGDPAAGCFILLTQ
jgi:hypothetical protein